MKLNKFTRLNKNINNKNNKDKGVNIVKAKVGNRQCLSADGFSLLPSALRPCLFGLMVLLTTSIAFISTFSTNSVSATASTLSLTVGSSTLSLDLKPISSNGTFARSSGSVNIGVNTNNSSGFTLKFAPSTADDRILSDGNGNSITTLDEAIDTATFSGSDNTTTYNNKWGYLPSRICSTVNNTATCIDNTTNYYPAPTTTGDILDVTNSANASSTTSDDSTYTIAIGARASTETKMGTYEGTFVITAVANPIPYTISYNKNTEDTVTNMPTTTSGSTTAVTITNVINNKVPVRTGYKFLGWCSTTTVIVDNMDTCSGTIYNPNGGGTNRNYTLDQTGSNTNIILYAMWQRTYNVTFVAGNNIDLVIVADSSNNWRPYYTSGNTPVTRAVPAGTRLAVTVVPVANYILDSWTSNSGSTNNLTDSTLLTTTYTVGATDETLTATGVAADYTDPTKSYTSMKDFALSNCTAAGNNVTDSRDGKSYTVAKFENYCYMLSNLRLDSGIELEATYSDIKSGGVTYTDPSTGQSVTTTTFTTPTEAWVSSSQDYYCKAIMKHYNQGSGSNYANEYYYNWYAAKANPYQCLNPTSYNNATSTNDGYTLGSICPKGWTLPSYYNDITGGALWNSGINSGMLETAGWFRSGSQQGLGGIGYWWSKSGSTNSVVYDLRFDGADAVINRNWGKYAGYTVRCMRGN